MDNADLILLYGKTQKSTAGSWWMDNSGEIHRGNPPAEIVGTMRGNVGTPRRSRKGRTYHAPNGSRRYIENWYGHTVEGYLRHAVVAYSAGKVVK